MKYTVCWYCSLVMCPLKWNLMWMFTLKHYVSLTDADLHVQLWWLWQPQFVTQGEEDHSSHGCVFSGKNCCFILSSLFEFVHVCCWGMRKRPVSFSLFLWNSDLYGLRVPPKMFRRLGLRESGLLQLFLIILNWPCGSFWMWTVCLWSHRWHWVKKSDDILQ